MRAEAFLRKQLGEDWWLMFGPAHRDALANEFALVEHEKGEALKGECPVCKARHAFVAQVKAP